MLSISYFVAAAGYLYSALVPFAPDMQIFRSPAAALIPLLLAACAATPAGMVTTPAATACESLPPELDAERSAWLAPASAVPVASLAASARPVVTLTRTRLKLLPQGTFNPVALTKAEANPVGTFGGLMAFAPGRGGVFRISVSEKTWIELIDRNTGATVSPVSSDKRLRCFGVPKALLFELKPGRDYLLQISGAANSELDLLIAQAAK